MIDLVAEAARLGEAGVPAALATVIRTSGSTPRHAGAKMIVRADGSIEGTIGGGRIELEVVTVAQEIARGARPATRLTKHLVQDLAMCCGGSMDVWLEPLDASRWKPLAEAARRRRARLPCTLVTALDAVGGKDVRPGAGERAELDGERLSEPILPAERLVLFGAGHVAQAIAPIAASVGFDVVVCDDEEGWASAERFPAAQLVHSFAPRDVARELAPFGARDYAVILTRDHAVDQQILEAIIALDAPLAYLGLIGSRGKVERFRRRLEAKGLALPPDLHSPVGLHIGAETPEEIAVAIVAELVGTRRGALT